MKSSFFLIIPKQRRNEERLKSFAEISLKKWLATLPSANYGLSVQLLYDLLLEFNKTEMDACFRLDALEILRPSLLSINEYLRVRLIDSGFPKTEEQQKIFRILISVQKEVAISYWIAAKALTKKNKWLKGKETTLAIQRVLNGLGEIIISCYLFKVPVPGWIWIDIHALYKLADKVGKCATKVPDQSCYFYKSLSIEDCYKRILLLALTQPSGLRQKEVLQAYFFSEYLCAFLEIKYEIVPGQRCQNVILTEEDREPFQINSAAFVTTEARVIFLNFTRVAVQLFKIKKVLRGPSSRFGTINLDVHAIDKLPLEFIDYCEKSWAGFNLNKTAAFTDRLDRWFSIGLATTYELLMTPTHDITAELDFEYLAQTSSEKNLSFKSQITGVLSIGSLISLRRIDDNHNKRSVGIITRISMSALDTDTDFEFYLLGDNIKAATIHDLDHGAVSEEIPVLFYIDEANLNRPSYLIMESFRLKNEDIVRLILDDREFPVVLRKRKNIGLGFWQFECRRIKEQLRDAYLNKQGQFVI